MQAGVLGGHLRVASVGAFDVTTQRGLELMALGPLASDNDTILVALRPFTSAAAPANASFAYYSASLDYHHPQNSTVVTSAVFYAAVLDHAVEWEQVFAPAMKVSLPFAERRQTDMAKGVLVSTSTVFIGDHPNYGTDVYWLDGPPVEAMLDTSGIGDSLPLTTLALDTALLQVCVWALGCVVDSPSQLAAR
jgi:hypothetical protein